MTVNELIAELQKGREHGCGNLPVQQVFHHEVFGRYPASCEARTVSPHPDGDCVVISNAGAIPGSEAAHDAALEAVAERMRQCELRDAASARDCGEYHGQLWAREKATPDQLRRLDRATEDGIAALVENMDDVPSELSRVIFGVGADPKEEWAAALDNWPDIADADFARGFCRAALNVWSKVKSRL